MLKITTEKDDFTGLRSINTNFFGLNDLLTFSGPTEIYLDFLKKQNSGIKSNVIDAIDLMYIEHENGKGNVVIRVVSAIGKYLRNTEWPHWDDNWPMIIDGERININSSSTNSFETSYELKVYDLPIDIFSKICNSKETKYSLRGRSSKVEGVFSEKHLEIFRVFEQYCFGDESGAEKKLKEINKILPASGESDFTDAIPTKKLTPEEIEKHENKTTELIKEKKVNDAIKYYASNFSISDENAKIKIKELAEKNGLASIITANTRKNSIIGLIFYIPIFSYLCYLGGLPTSQGPFPLLLWIILIILFGFLTIRSIIRLFKK
jgi:hypothetical protein